MVEFDCMAAFEGLTRGSLRKRRNHYSHPVYSPNVAALRIEDLSILKMYLYTHGYVIMKEFFNNYVLSSIPSVGFHAAGLQCICVRNNVLIGYIRIN